LRDHVEEIRAVGARLAAIGTGKPSYARTFRADAGIDFPLLVDPGLAAYRAAGLEKASVFGLVDPRVALATARAVAAGHRQGRTGSEPMQLGGSFVFAPGDRELFAHVSGSFSDNAPVNDLLAVLRAASAGDAG
jgi:hypothetical protein